MGAFLGGLLLVGLVLLWPGSEEKPPPGSSVFSPPAPAGLPGATDHPAGGNVEGPTAPRLAIVVADLGYDPVRDAEWLRFPEKLTVSVLPFGPSSRNIASSAQERGFCVLVNVPMEPENPTATSDGTGPFRLRRGMTESEMEAAFERMAGDIPMAAGASNYMGSAFTADPAAMASFAEVLKKRGFFFLDSLTAQGSVGLEAARRAGVPSLGRDVFLDDDTRPAEIRRQWARALALAKERGEAVLICHSRPETYKAVIEMLPDLRKEGIRTVTVQELLADPQKG